MLIKFLESASEKKMQSETSLSDSETRYNTLFENASDAIFIVDEDIFADCNPSALQIFALTFPK